MDAQVGATSVGDRLIAELPNVRWRELKDRLRADRSISWRGDDLSFQSNEGISVRRVGGIKNSSVIVLEEDHRSPYCSTRHGLVDAVLCCSSTCERDSTPYRWNYELSLSDLGLTYSEAVRQLFQVSVDRPERGQDAFVSYSDSIEIGRASRAIAEITVSASHEFQFLGVGPFMRQVGGVIQVKAESRSPQALRELLTEIICRLRPAYRISGEGTFWYAKELAQYLQDISSDSKKEVIWGERVLIVYVGKTSNGLMLSSCRDRLPFWFSPQKTSDECVNATSHTMIVTQDHQLIPCPKELLSPFAFEVSRVDVDAHGEFCEQLKYRRFEVKRTRGDRPRLVGYWENC